MAERILARAARPISSASPASASITWPDVSARMISRPGTSRSSMPSQRSEMTGTPHAPASKRRTEGDQPAAIMSARVTFSVKRDAE
jgi:hypothetical protein